MGLRTPQSAILSAVMFNALIIVALVPLALRGISYRPEGAAALLRRQPARHGVGGIVAPFVGIKIIDVVITALHLAQSGPPPLLENTMNVMRNIVTAALMTVVTTLLLGIVYRLAMTGIAQALFSDKANGQLIEQNGKVVGSRIIGQGFSSPGDFSRLSDPEPDMTR